MQSLLSFVTTSDMLQTLCGGVHVLDFFTRNPDLYASVLPLSWREWLHDVEISDLLDLLMREDLSCLVLTTSNTSGTEGTWRGHALPPKSFMDYVSTVRKLSLDRTFSSSNTKSPSLSRHISVGMNVKKAHEVTNFAAFVNELTVKLACEDQVDITHIVDFGSGQNYLGRVLAGPLYRKQVVAVESKVLNIDGAKAMDVNAKLAKKQVIWRNKRAYRDTGIDNAHLEQQQRESLLPDIGDQEKHSEQAKLKPIPQTTEELGKIQYIEHVISDGNLDNVVQQLHYTPPSVDSLVVNGNTVEKLTSLVY